MLQPVGRRHPQAFQHDVGLLDRPLAHLAGDDLGPVAGRVLADGGLLDDEGVDLPVLGAAREQHDHVGRVPVADPALVPVDHPGVPVPAGGGLQGHRVGAVLGLGEGERPGLLQPGHGRQPAVLLLL